MNVVVAGLPSPLLLSCSPWPIPSVFSGLSGERAVRRGEARQVWHRRSVSWSGRGPGRADPVDDQDVRAPPVESRGPGVDVAGDTVPAAVASFAPPQRRATKWAGFAFHGRPGGSVGVLPLVGLLVRLVGLEDVLVGVDGVGPPGPVGGGKCPMRERPGDGACESAHLTQALQ